MREGEQDATTVLTDLLLGCTDARGVEQQFVTIAMSG